MQEYRYYITDNHRIGTLISSDNVIGKEMLLLVGYVINVYGDITVNNVVRRLVNLYGFKIMKENISAVELNTSPETPYTYYDLIDEAGYCEDDGYMYTDIDRIKQYFSGKKSLEMIKSIGRFSPKPFS